MKAVRADKKLGQHWLNDSESLGFIVNYANLRAEDKVLEIGPGTGELTARLIKTVNHITALELDERLIEGLEVRFVKDKDRLDIIKGDIRTFDLTKLHKDYKLVANIPYYLSAYILRILFETNNRPSVAVLLVQKEVAERVGAKSGQASLLSVMTQIYYEVRMGEIIYPDKFTPPPKVDSQILILTRRPQPLLNIDKKRFLRILKAGFSERRKKLRSSLSGGLRLDKYVVEELCKKAGVDPNLRAQNLGLNDWYSLYLELEND